MTSPSVVLEGLLAAQTSLDKSQQWQLRPATASSAGDATFFGRFDGEGLNDTVAIAVPMISLVGYVGADQRVMILCVPPAGNYAIARLSSADESVWNDYAPEFTAATTDPNVGDAGHVLGRWVEIAPRTIAVEIDILFSGSGISAGLGQYFITTPFSVAERSISAATGAVYMLDSGTANRAGIVNVTSGGDNYFITNTPSGDVDNDTPQVWASGDAIRFTIVHEIESFGF